MAEASKGNRFYNPGMLGDIVYAIPFCLSCAGILDSSQLSNGGRFDYYLDLCLLHKEDGRQKAMDTLRMLADVLRMQPYIGELHVEMSIDLKAVGALDLGIIRKGRVSMQNGDITRRLPDYYDASTPWLVVDGHDDPKYDWLEGRIAVFRSPRYRNKRIWSYNELKPFVDRLVYFGTDKEHESFCRENGWNVQKFHGSFVDICRAFQRVSFVVGNQTFLFSLAEALKVPRLCEMASNIPDVMPLGRLANCFVDNEDLRACLDMYRNELEL